jgi:predicted dehydrogenase
VDIIRWAVIGMGNMGSAYAGLLRDGKIPGSALAAVCDRDPARLSAWPGVKTFPDVKQLLKARAADAVIISTPHFDHVPAGVAALRAGCHVVVDKPIAPTKRGAEQLLRVPRRKGQVAAAMFNQRTDPRYVRLRELIQRGELGRIQRMNWIITDWFRPQSYYASGSWRATWRGEGGGVLLNQSPHQLDLWQWLFGMPVRVRAFCGFGRHHAIEVEDEVTAYLEYADGANGVFITTTGEAPGTNRLEIAADLGRVVIEDNRLTFTRNRTSAREFLRTSDKPFSAPERDVSENSFTGNGPQHAGILTNVAAAIRGQAELISPLDQGLHSVELANAMLLSALQQKTVDLPLRSTVYERTLKRLVAESDTRTSAQGGDA